MSILVVTQALPGAGKTEITSYLAKERGFTRLCIEDVLRKQLGRDWWTIVKKKNPWWWKAAWDRHIFQPMEKALSKGRSVAVDTTIGATKWPENHYRIESLFYHAPKATHCLLEISARPSIRYQRISRRHGISLAKASKWDSSYIWRKRWVPPKNVKLLKFNNNTPKDLEKMKKSLGRILG